jgi:hypothetical protein
MRTHGKRADSRRVVLLSSLDKPTIRVQILWWQQAAAGSITTQASEIDLRREMSGKRPGFHDRSLPIRGNLVDGLLFSLGGLPFVLKNLNLGLSTTISDD